MSRSTRRQIEGYTLVAVGAALIVLPGPGIPLIIAGAARVRSSKAPASHSC
ncbi:MAG: PGPGW domain-containing protein [Actinobacteria bacterium]|nr:PGPGW domain-containing protein [Actinomycetota bacterium]